MVAGRRGSAATCPPDVGPSRVLRKWREFSKNSSNSDRTGVLRKKGPVIEISMEDLTRRMEQKNGRPQSHEIAKDSNIHNYGIRSSRIGRQSNRLLRREHERAIRERVRCQRQVSSALETQLNSIKGGNASRIALTLNKLQRWQ